MRSKSFGLVVAIGGVALAAAGCSDEGTSVKTMRNQAVTSSSAMLREVGHSLEFVPNLQSVTAISDGLAPVGSMSERLFPSEAEVPPPAPLPMRNRSSQGLEEDPSGPGAMADEAATELERILQDYVFADENLEESGDDFAIFLIKASTVCPKARDEEVANCDTIDWGCDYVTPPDASCLEAEAGARADCRANAEEDYLDCLEVVPKLEVRVKVKVIDGDEEKLDLSLLLGPGRINPVDVLLRPDSIGADFDLAAIEQAVAHVTGALGGEAPIFPEQFVGVIGLSVKKNGEQDFTLAAAIKEALIVAGEFETGSSVACSIDEYGNEVCSEPEVERVTLSLQSAPADPLVAVRVQGADKKLTVDLDVNATTFRTPFAGLFDFGSPTGDFIVDLAGFNGQLILQEGVEALVLNALGFGAGESSVRHDEVDLVTVNLNAADGRAVSQTTTVVDGWPVFTFDPSLNLDVYVNLGYLDAFQDPLAEPTPGFLRDQTYTLSLLPGLSGAPAISGYQGVAEVTDDDALQVLSGTLSFASTAAPEATVTVEEGQCLFVSDTLADGAHELLGHFSAGVCQ